MPLPTDYEDAVAPTGALTEWPATTTRGVNAFAAAINNATTIHNVKSYGAVGNGSTDDTTAIANAITAAKGSGGLGIVYFPPGTYVTSPITVPSGVILEGTLEQGYIDWSGTISNTYTVSKLLLKAGSASALISPNDTGIMASFVQIRNLALNCNGLNYPAINIPDGTAGQRNWRIEKCYISNVNSANTASGYAVYIGNGQVSVTMRDCIVWNGVTGAANTTQGYNGIGWYGSDGQMFNVWIGGFRNAGFYALGGDNDYSFQWVGGGTFWNTTNVIGGKGFTFVGVSFDHSLNEGIYCAYSATFINCDFHTNSITTDNTWSHINVAGTNCVVTLVGCRVELTDAAVSNHVKYFVNNTGGATNTINIIGCYDNSGGQFSTGWAYACPQIVQVAGVVGDGSFALAPPDGTFGLDTSNSRLYVRINGAWHYTALT